MPSRPKTLAAITRRRRQPDCDTYRPSAARRGYDRDWASCRAFILAHEPCCRLCAAKGLTVAATEVDHITPIARGGQDDTDNLQPLCKPCHSKKTVRQDGGFGRMAPS